MRFFARFGNITGFWIQGKPVFVRGRLPAWHAIRRMGLAVSVTAALVVCGGASAKSPPEVSAAIGSVGLAELPSEARVTQRLIRAGGPFPYPKDGIVFGNRERVLPAEPRGFYREYTVPTPGVRSRGARRIVCGGRQPENPEACYYSGDHYANFRRIVN